MLVWLQNNWINILIVAIVLAGFIAAIRYQRRISKSGGCAGCSGCSSCSKCEGDWSNSKEK